MSTSYCIVGGEQPDKSRFHPRDFGGVNEPVAKEALSGAIDGAVFPELDLLRELTNRRLERGLCRWLECPCKRAIRDGSLRWNGAMEPLRRPNPRFPVSAGPRLGPPIKS